MLPNYSALAAQMYAAQLSSQQQPNMYVFNFDCFSIK